MKDLRNEFDGIGEVRGYHFRLLERLDNSYLYEVSSIDVVGRCWYEVFERRENVLYDCVTYPKGVAFGVWAFCCMDLFRARCLLSDLDVRVRSRVTSSVL